MQGWHASGRCRWRAVAACDMMGAEQAAHRLSSHGRAAGVRAHTGGQQRLDGLPDRLLPTCCPATPFLSSLVEQREVAEDQLLHQAGRAEDRRRHRRRGEGAVGGG